CGINGVISLQFHRTHDKERLYLAHVVISYHDMKQSELRRRVRAINLAVEFKPSVSPFTPALTLNGYPEH
ncbi:hypothetical protein, partial [Dickeya dadantii]|uniref:hypothetical protein n=1 Tax=Dickeya dadantii TaxID=204038 RepID=UPI001C131B08